MKHGSAGASWPRKLRGPAVAISFLSPPKVAPTNRGPKDHMNIRISLSGPKDQHKGDTRNHDWWAFGALIKDLRSLSGGVYGSSEVALVGCESFED